MADGANAVVGSARERRLSEALVPDAPRAGPDRTTGRQDQRRSLIRIEEKDITNNNASGLRRAHQDLMIEIARLVQQDRPYGLPRGSSEDAG